MCGGTFTSETGVIVSPMYPSNYEMSRTCEYIIEAPLGKAVILDFIDMDIEDNSSPSCEFDYLEVGFLDIPIIHHHHVNNLFCFNV